MFKNEEGKWACNGCEYSSHASTSVKEHIESKHVEAQKYPCNTCGHVCPTRKALKMHIFRNKHYWLSSKCQRYFSYFIFLEYLDASIRNKMVRTADGFYTCTDCDYSTRYLTTCQNHIESKHVSTAGIQCQFCTTVCPTRHALTMHMGRRHKKNIWFIIWLM